MQNFLVLSCSTTRASSFTKAAKLSFPKHVDIIVLHISGGALVPVWLSGSSTKGRNELGVGTDCRRNPDRMAASRKE